jgi:hypothetical protein
MLEIRLRRAFCAKTRRRHAAFRAVPLTASKELRSNCVRTRQQVMQDKRQ